MESIEYPDGFNSSTDILILDLTSEENANMYAYQAQKVNSIYRMKIIACLQQYDEDFNTSWNRTDDSLFTEWESHHFFSPFDKSAQDIEFDNAEEGWTFEDYLKKAYQRAKDKYFG
jgi:hypothetical protein